MVNGLVRLGGPSGTVYELGSGGADEAVLVIRVARRQASRATMNVRMARDVSVTE